MKRLLPAVFLAMALLAVESALGQEAASEARHSDLVQLRVSVFDSSPIAPETLEDAEKEAGRIFRDAGIAVIWLNCHRHTLGESPLGRCAEVSFPSHLRLHILGSSEAGVASTAGQAFFDENGEGCCAHLFYQSIQRLEAESPAPAYVILGHVMAHELGHLLLGFASHSLNGLMRAHWSHKDLRDMAQGTLRFSQEQSLKIRNRLAQGVSRNQQAIEAAWKQPSEKDSNIRMEGEARL